MDAKKGMLGEYRIAVRGLAKMAGIVLSLALLFFFLGLDEVALFGRAFPVLIPGADPSVAEWTLTTMQERLAPDDVPFVVTNPLAAFLAQMKIALALGFLVAFPYLLHRLMHYLAPALHMRELRALRRTTLAATALFALGVAFSYFVVIPPTYTLLYGYAAGVDALMLFSVSEFVGYTIALAVVSGLLFLLPVVMVLLVRFGIVPARFWVEHWRVALLSTLVATAVLTPDGSGITMALLSVPLVALYALGASFGHHVDGSRTSKALPIE